MNDNGYVYILTNSSMPHIVVIGKTEKTSEERAEELTEIADVTSPFDVIYDCFFENSSAAEKYVHALIEDKGYGITSNREFFEIPVKEAINILLNAKEHFEKFEGCDSDNALLRRKKYNPDLENTAIRELIKRAKEYQYGFWGEIQDINKAITFYNKAIKLGSLEAYSELGSIYYLGEEVENNRDKAIEYFKEGAKNGNLSCHASLAVIYLDLEKDDEAYKSWKKFFTLNDYFTPMDGVNYLKFIAMYPNYRIEFTDKLEKMGNELFEHLYKFNLVTIVGTKFKLSPKFIEYVRDVIYDNINQEENNLYRHREDTTNLQNEEVNKKGILKKLFR